MLKAEANLTQSGTLCHSDGGQPPTPVRDAKLETGKGVYDPFAEFGDHDWMTFEEEAYLFSGEPAAFFSEVGSLFEPCTAPH